MDKTNKPKLDHQTMPMDPELDPIVEILRLAYRRGLAIRREREQQAKAIEEKMSDIDKLPDSSKHVNKED